MYVWLVSCCNQFCDESEDSTDSVVVISGEQLVESKAKSICVDVMFLCVLICKHVSGVCVCR